MVWARNEDARHKITQEDIYIGTYWKETLSEDQGQDGEIR